MRPSDRCHLLFEVVACVVFAACARNNVKDNASTANTSVTIVLNWVAEPEFGGIFSARDEGEYRARHLEVKVLSGGAGSPVVQMVATGQVEFGVVGGDEVILARAQGADIVAVFGTFQTSPQGIMVHASRHLTSMEQALHSGTLAIEPGLPYALYLRDKFGFGEAKVVPYDGGIARFMADVDYVQQCYVTSEPLTAKLASADPQVFMVADTGYNPYASVVITRGDYLARHRDVVANFVAATRLGWQRYLRDPAACNRTMSRANPAMSEEAMRLAAEAQRPLLDGGGPPEQLGRMKQERWNTLIDQLARLKVVTQPVGPSEVWSDLPLTGL